MIRATLAIVLVLGSFSTAWGLRVLEQVETPFELSLDQVKLPANAAGSVTFKACDTCPTSAHSVNAATKYFINGTEVPLKDLLVAVGDIRQTKDGEESTFVGVYVDIASQRVARITVQQRNR